MEKTFYWFGVKINARSGHVGGVGVFCAKEVACEEPK
jgi:hypothetical protein